MENTEIVVAVDKKEAIKRGVNTTIGPVALEVDVSSLKQDHRDLIAALVGDDGQLKTNSGSLLRVPMPTVEGLIEALDLMLVERAKRMLEAEQCRVEADAAIAKAIADFEAGITKDEVSCSAMSSCGKLEFVKDLNRGCGVKGNAPKIDNVYSAASASPNMVAEYEAAKKRCETMRLDAFEALKPLAEQKFLEAAAKAAAELAKKNAVEARRKAQIEKTVQAVGGIFAERFKAGYSSEKEVIEKIRELEREARHLAFTGDYAADWDRSVCEVFDAPLSNEQFVALKEFKAKLPDQTEVQIYEMFDHVYVDGTEDGDSRVNRILIADAAWKVGEVKVKADCKIGDLPDLANEDDE